MMETLRLTNLPSGLVDREILKRESEGWEVVEYETVKVTTATLVRE